MRCLAFPLGLALLVAINAGCTSGDLRDLEIAPVPEVPRYKVTTRTDRMVFAGGLRSEELRAQVCGQLLVGISAEEIASASISASVESSELLTSMIECRVKPEVAMSSYMRVGGDPVDTVEYAKSHRISPETAFRAIKEADVHPDDYWRAVKALHGGNSQAAAGVAAAPGLAFLRYTTPAPFRKIRVFFATDRNRAGTSDPVSMFGNDRRADITLGRCEVSIPESHSIGELETPGVFSRWWFGPDPAKHVVLLRVEARTSDQFLNELRDRLRGARHRDALVFIHGYNVSFEDAARRTAQLSYDLRFEGPALFFSWPSQGTARAYPVDEQSIAWSQVNLKAFLERLLHEDDAKNIYVVAHSMGSRALTYAISALVKESPTQAKRIREVILAAPDIDAGIFRRDIAPAFVGAGQSVTLYASSSDVALSASKSFHGYPRAGESGPGMVVASGIETIDATGVESDFLGHSYYAAVPEMLNDMYYLIRNGLRAEHRFGLSAVDSPDGRYWKFKKRRK